MGIVGGIDRDRALICERNIHFGIITHFSFNGFRDRNLLKSHWFLHIRISC